MERRRFVSFNLTLFFFFFLLLPHLHRSKSRIHRFTPVLSNALVLSLSLEISCILKLKHDYISIYIYIYTDIYTHKAISSVTRRNAKPITACHTGRRRYS